MGKLVLNDVLLSSAMNPSPLMNQHLWGEEPTCPRVEKKEASEPKKVWRRASLNDFLPPKHANRKNPEMTLKKIEMTSNDLWTRADILPSEMFAIDHEKEHGFELEKLGLSGDFLMFFDISQPFDDPLIQQVIDGLNYRDIPHAERTEYLKKLKTKSSHNFNCHTQHQIPNNNSVFLEIPKNCLNGENMLQNPSCEAPKIPTQPINTKAAKAVPKNEEAQIIDYNNIDPKHYVRSKEMGYATAMSIALKNNGYQPLQVQQIYVFFTVHFPYQRTANNSWQNAIRHNLSKQPDFYKVTEEEGQSEENTGGREAAWWGVSYTEKSEKRILKAMKVDPKLFGMRRPEDWPKLASGEMGMPTKEEYEAALKEDQRIGMDFGVTENKKTVKQEPMDAPQKQKKPSAKQSSSKWYPQNVENYNAYGQEMYLVGGNNAYYQENPVQYGQQQQIYNQQRGQTPAYYENNLENQQRIRPQMAGDMQMVPPEDIYNQEWVDYENYDAAFDQRQMNNGTYENGEPVYEQLQRNNGPQTDQEPQYIQQAEQDIFEQNLRNPQNQNMNQFMNNQLQQGNILQIAESALFPQEAAYNKYSAPGPERNTMKAPTKRPNILTRKKVIRPLAPKMNTMPQLEHFDA